MTQAYTSSTAIKTRLGLTDSTDDTLLGTIATQTNEWLEGYIGRAVGPITGGTVVFDGTGYTDLDIPQGIRTVSSLTIVETDGGTACTVGTADVRLWPVESHRRPGWPAFTLQFKAVTTSGWSYFPAVREGVTIVGNFGWAAIPGDLADIATTLAISKWRARGSGGADSVTVGMDGERRFERALGFEDRKTLDRYRIDPVGIG